MSIHRGINKEDMVNKYIKKNEKLPFAAKCMDLEIIILSEVRQRKRNIMIPLLCGILKNDTNEFILKTDWKTNNLRLPKGKGRRGKDKLGVLD